MRSDAPARSHVLAPVYRALSSNYRMPATAHHIAPRKAAFISPARLDGALTICGGGKNVLRGYQQTGGRTRAAVYINNRVFGWPNNALLLPLPLELFYVRQPKRSARRTVVGCEGSNVCCAPYAGTTAPLGHGMHIWLSATGEIWCQRQGLKTPYRLGVAGRW